MSPRATLAILIVVLTWSEGGFAVHAQPVASNRLPNPYTSLPPPEVEPDWAYWQARMQAGRAVQRLLPKANPIVEEQEPADARGWNDVQSTAEWLPDWSAGRSQEIELLGTLRPPAPRDLGTITEADDGAIPLALATNLVSGESIRADAYIGDGPYGREGIGTGDYDFYHVGSLEAGQVITAKTETSHNVNPRLDTKVGLYNSAGVRLFENDDRFRGDHDSFLEIVIPTADEYFVLVRGINSDWPGDPFDSASGPKAGSEGPYDITISVDDRDVDFFGFDLVAGDILNISVHGWAHRITVFDGDGIAHISVTFDLSVLYPLGSGLRFGGNANLAYVIRDDGPYAVAVERGDGAYTLHLQRSRPRLEYAQTPQTLFLDFDGAVYDAEAVLGGNSMATLSPLSASLGRLGLDPAGDEDAVITRILATVTENLADDIRMGANPGFQLKLRNSRDDPDPWGDPNTSRIIIGGTIHELGLNTIGIAESVDVGNFVTEETAIVLLDRLTGPDMLGSLEADDFGAGTSIIDALGTAVGNIVSHEAGHLFANFHTGHPAYRTDLMDASTALHTFIGSGPDGVFGSHDDLDIDFGIAAYNVVEGIKGIQDTRNAIAFGLYGPSVTTRSRDTLPGSVVLGAAHPNPFQTETRFMLRVPRLQHMTLAVFDMLGRRIHLLHDGVLTPGSHVFTLAGSTLPSGIYFIRGTGSHSVVSRSVVVAR